EPVAVTLLPPSYAHVTVALFVRFNCETLVPLTLVKLTVLPLILKLFTTVKFVTFNTSRLVVHCPVPLASIERNTQPVPAPLWNLKLLVKSAPLAVALPAIAMFVPVVVKALPAVMTEFTFVPSFTRVINGVSGLVSNGIVGGSFPVLFVVKLFLKMG